ILVLQGELTQDEGRNVRKNSINNNGILEIKMKGSFIVAVLCVVFVQAVADFGPWSDFGDCLCDSKKYRSRVCASEPCVGDYVDSEGCDCVPLNPAVDCPMVSGAESVYGIVADPCDCHNYYQCEYNTTTAEFIAYERRCPKCLRWSQEILTCVRDEKDPNCTSTTPAIQEPGACDLMEVPENERQFLLGNYTMDCPPGTYFNVTVCGCVPWWTPMPEMNVIASVMFNEAVSASNGIWLLNQNVSLVNDDCMDGECGRFNSSAHSKLEIPFFSNGVFESFSVRLFFKRSAGVSGVQSLLDNSDCSNDGFVLAQSGVDIALGYFENKANIKIDFSLAAAEGTWNQLVMSYDEDVASFYLNKDLVYTEASVGQLKHVIAPMVLGGCVCGGDCYFSGYMDSVCFFKGGLGQTEVDYLYDNPDKCEP
ncbi:hypothetical protein LSAT2_018587, partial [Lamellibrachia satsuma]